MKNLSPRRTLRRSLSAIAFFFAIAAFASAQVTNTPATPVVHVAGPDVTFSFIRVLGALALVIALFLGAAWLLRNWQRLTAQKGRTPKLNVLEVKSLGHRHAVYVIAYEQQRFLISSAPTGISLLTHLPAGDADAPDPVPIASFPETLLQALGRK